MIEQKRIEEIKEVYQGSKTRWAEHIHELLSAIASLQKRLNDPQQCNSGHKDWPLTLWDCPTCVGKIRGEVERLENELAEYHKAGRFLIEGKEKERDLARAAVGKEYRILPDEEGEGGETWQQWATDLDMQRMELQAAVGRFRGALEVIANDPAVPAHNRFGATKALTDTGGKCDCIDTNKHCPPNHHHKGPCCVAGNVGT